MIGTWTGLSAASWTTAIALLGASGTLLLVRTGIKLVWSFIERVTDHV